MAGAYSAIHTDVFAVLGNTASLARQEQFSAGMYAEQRFMLKALTNYTGAVTLPVRSGNFAITTGYRGGAEMNDYKLGLAYARKLGKIIDMGAKFTYHGLSIQGYGTAGAVGLEWGAMLYLTDKLRAGVQLVNPVSSKFGINRDEKLASVYTGGLGYDVGEHFFISTVFVKEEDHDMVIQTNMLYQVSPVLQVRGGINSGIASYWLGVGIGLKSMRVHVTTVYHNRLGLSPGILVMYQPPKL